MANRRKDRQGKVLKKGETQRQDNTYMYRWLNNSGKRECIYARTLVELRNMEQEIEREIALGISRKTYTLNEQIERYLKTKVSLANSTRENYKYYFEHVIRESQLGKTKVIEIRKFL